METKFEISIINTSPDASILPQAFSSSSSSESYLCLPMLETIIDITRNTFSLSHRSIHGIEHWKRVEENGIFLARQPDTDILVVRLFSYLHDCKREDDFDDPFHGERAAAFAITLRNGVLSQLTEMQMEKLYWACFHHNRGVTHTDPTIGACFDADRLELTRCGIIPRVSLMSTPLGKKLAAEKSQKR